MIHPFDVVFVILYGEFPPEIVICPRINDFEVDHTQLS